MFQLDDEMIIAHMAGYVDIKLIFPVTSSTSFLHINCAHIASVVDRRPLMLYDVQSDKTAYSNTEQ